jgi:hypothetical protein
MSGLSNAIFYDEDVAREWLEARIRAPDVIARNLRVMLAAWIDAAWKLSGAPATRSCKPTGGTARNRL